MSIRSLCLIVCVVLLTGCGLWNHSPSPAVAEEIPAGPEVPVVIYRQNSSDPDALLDAALYRLNEREYADSFIYYPAEPKTIDHFVPAFLEGLYTLPNPLPQVRRWDTFVIMHNPELASPGTPQTTFRMVVFTCDDPVLLQLLKAQDGQPNTHRLPPQDGLPGRLYDNAVADGGLYYYLHLSDRRAIFFTFDRPGGTPPTGDPVLLEAARQLVECLEAVPLALGVS